LTSNKSVKDTTPRGCGDHLDRSNPIPGRLGIDCTYKVDG
jgi:hypothetical protein